MLLANGSQTARQRDFLTRQEDVCRPVSMGHQLLHRMHPCKAQHSQDIHPSEGPLCQSATLQRAANVYQKLQKHTQTKSCCQANQAACMMNVSISAIGVKQQPSSHLQRDPHCKADPCVSSINHSFTPRLSTDLCLRAQHKPLRS